MVYFLQVLLNICQDGSLPVFTAKKIFGGSVVKNISNSWKRKYKSIILFGKKRNLHSYLKNTFTELSLKWKSSGLFRRRIFPYVFYLWCGGFCIESEQNFPHHRLQNKYNGKLFARISVQTASRFLCGICRELSVRKSAVGMGPQIGNIGLLCFRNAILVWVVLFWGKKQTKLII